MLDFSEAEYHARLVRAQQRMGDCNLDALLLTTEPEIRYFTGFRTRFWESPTRPWFLVVPRVGKCVAVIPSIGEWLMSQCYVGDILTWSSPNLVDDGVSLLAKAICDKVGSNAQIGIPDGNSTQLRMPIADFERLKQKISPAKVVGDFGILAKLRMIKSEAEVKKIEHACIVAGKAFNNIASQIKCGDSLSYIFRKFQELCLAEGADWVAYLAGGAGNLGCPDVISPASNMPLASNQLLMLDTGVVVDGYFADFNRNYLTGEAKKEVLLAWDNLLEATEAGKMVAKSGNSAADVYHAMINVISRINPDNNAGRLGHGLGMQLTEWPSLIADDHTELKSGMVITLEPSIKLSDVSVLVHEENYVITDNGIKQLSPPAPLEFLKIK